MACGVMNTESQLKIYSDLKILKPSFALLFVSTLIGFFIGTLKIVALDEYTKQFNFKKY
jgi:hypothetical protein